MSLGEIDVLLANRIAACLNQVEVEEFTELAFRSQLRKNIVNTQALASQVCAEKKAHLFNSLLYSAYKSIGCLHGLVVQETSSFLVHTSAREFREENFSNVSHVPVDDLKKALLQYLPKGCGASWVNRLSFSGHAVSDNELSALTDELGVIGGVARAANRVAYIISPPNAATIQIASTWDDDLKPGKPLRATLESVGTINKWAECDAVGNMLVEMCDEESVATLLNKGNPAQKGLVGHAPSRATETVAAAYSRLPAAAREEMNKGVLTGLLKEASDQAEFLVGRQVKARELLTQTSDPACRERMHVILEVLRRLILVQTHRVNAYRAMKDALKDEGMRQSGSGVASSKFQKLLNPIRKASSNALASLAEKRRPSNQSGSDLSSMVAPSAPVSDKPPEVARSASSLLVEEETGMRRRSNTMGAPPVPVSSKRSSSISDEDSASDSTSQRSSGVLSSSATAVSEDEKKKTYKTGSLTRPRKGTLGRRKTRKPEDDGSSSSSASVGSALSSHAGAGQPSLFGPEDSMDSIFSKMIEQMKAAQTELVAREEDLKLREGRLRAKKKQLRKKQQAANEKLAELQADLDRRERALEQRERSYERRVKKLTRLQKEEHMKSLINSFTKEQVIPLQRALRKWWCRRALSKACKLILSAEGFKDGRRRNAALSEIYTSEVAHVNKMEQTTLVRSLMNEQFGNARQGISSSSFSKIFVGLDDALAASKALLARLGAQREQFPSNTRCGDLFVDWGAKQMTAYKLFVNNYDLSSATLLDLRTKKAYLEFEAQLSARGLPSLDSLLICPIQRLPRYRLLLEALLSFTPEEHCDRAALQKALEVVRKGVEEVNAGKAMAERMQVLLGLDEVVLNQDPLFPIVVPDRSLVFKGLLGDVMDQKAPLKQYLMFNDALFELVVRGKRGGLLASRKGDKEEYDFSRVFLLNAQIDLVEIAPSIISNGFTIRNASPEGNWKELSLFAPSPQDLRAWIVALKNLRRLQQQQQQMQPKLVCAACGASSTLHTDKCTACKHPFPIAEEEDDH